MKKIDEDWEQIFDKCGKDKLFTMTEKYWKGGCENER